MPLFNEEQANQIKNSIGGQRGLFSPEEVAAIKAQYVPKPQVQYSIPNPYDVSEYGITPTETPTTTPQQDIKVTDPYDVSTYEQEGADLKDTGSKLIPRMASRIMGGLSGDAGNLMEDINNVYSYTNRKLGGGVSRFQVVDQAAQLYAQNKAYWDEVVEGQSSDIGGLQKFGEEVVAGVLGSGIGAARFATGTIAAAVEGATKAELQGKSQLLGAIKEGGIRFAMGRFFKYLHPLANQGTIGNIKQVMYGGGGFAAESALRTKLEGGELDARELAKSAATGAIFSYSKKNPYLRKLEQQRDFLKSSEDLVRVFGPELAGVEERIGQFKEPVTILTDAKQLYNVAKDGINKFKNFTETFGVDKPDLEYEQRKDIIGKIEERKSLQDSLNQANILHQENIKRYKQGEIEEKEFFDNQRAIESSFNREDLKKNIDTINKETTKYKGNEYTIEKLIEENKDYFEVDMNILDKLLKRDKDSKLLAYPEQRVQSLQVDMDSRYAYYVGGTPFLESGVQPGQKVQVTIENAQGRHIPFEADYVQTNRGMTWLSIKGNTHAFPTAKIGFLRNVGSHEKGPWPEVTRDIMKANQETLFIGGGDLDPRRNTQKISMGYGNFELIPIKRTYVDEFGETREELFQDKDLPQNAIKISQAVDNIRRQLIGYDAVHDTWNVSHVSKKTFRYKEKGKDGKLKDVYYESGYDNFLKTKQMEHAPGWEVGDRVWLTSTDGRRTLVEITKIDADGKRPLNVASDKETVGGFFKSPKSKGRYTAREDRLVEYDDTGSYTRFATMENGEVVWHQGNPGKFKITSDKDIYVSEKDLTTGVGEVEKEKDVRFRGKVDGKEVVGAKAVHNYHFDIVDKPQVKEWKQLGISKDVGTELMMKSPKTYNYLLNELNGLNDFFRGIQEAKTGVPDKIVITNSGIWEFNKKDGWYKIDRQIAKVNKQTGAYTNKGEAIYDTDKGWVTRNGVLLERPGVTEEPIQAYKVGRLSYYSKNYKKGQKQQKEITQEIVDGERTSVILPFEMVENLKVGDIIELEPTFQSTRADSRTIPTVKVRITGLDHNVAGRLIKGDPTDPKKYLVNDVDFANDVGRTENLNPYKSTGSSWAAMQLFSPTYKGKDKYSIGRRTRIVFEPLEQRTTDKKVETSKVKETVDYTQARKTLEDMGYRILYGDIKQLPGDKKRVGYVDHDTGEVVIDGKYMKASLEIAKKAYDSSTLEEWENYIFAHELAHIKSGVKEGKDHSIYEKEINDYVKLQLSKPRNIEKPKGPQPTPEEIYQMEGMSESERHFQGMYNDFKDAMFKDSPLFHTESVKNIARVMDKYGQDYSPEIIASVRDQAFRDVQNNPYNLTLDSYIFSIPGFAESRVGYAKVSPEYKQGTPQWVTEQWGMNPQTRGQKGTSLKEIQNNSWYNYLNGTYTRTLPVSKGGGYTETTFYGANVNAPWETPMNDLRANISIWTDAKIKAYESGKIDRNSEQALRDYLDSPVLWEQFGKRSKWALDIEKSYNRATEILNEEIDRYGKDVQRKDSSYLGTDEKGNIIDPIADKESLDTTQDIQNKVMDLKEKLDEVSDRNYMTIDMLGRMMGLGNFTDKFDKEKQKKAINAYSAAELLYWQIDTESRKSGQSPKEYMHNMFKKMGFPSEMDLPHDQISKEVTVEKLADVLIGDYTKKIHDIKVDYYEKLKADEADKLDNPYSTKEKIKSSVTDQLNKEKKTLESARKYVSDVAKALSFYPDLPDNVRVSIDNFSASVTNKVLKKMNNYEKIIFGPLNTADKDIVAKYIALRSDLRLTKQKVWVEDPDGAKHLETREQDIGAHGRNTAKVWEELKAYREMINKLPEKRRDLILKGASAWDTAMQDQIMYLSYLNEINENRKKINYAPYFVEEYLPEWGSAVSIGLPSGGKLPFQGYLKQSHGTPRPRVLTPKMMIDFIGNVAHDVMVKDFMVNMLATNDLSPYLSTEQTKKFTEINPWGKHGEKEVVNGQKAIWFSPERWRFTTEFDKESAAQTITGYKQTFLIPETLYKGFDAWTSHNNTFVRQMNHIMKIWKGIAINTAYMSYNFNNLIGDTFLTFQMHPDRIGIGKEVGTGLTVANKMLQERAGIKVEYEPFERRLKEFLEKYNITDAGQTYSEIGHRTHADAARLEADMTSLGKVKEVGKYLAEGKSWHRVTNAMKEVSNYRESILRIANAAYILKEIEAGRSTDLEKKFGFLENRFKDGANDYERGSIIAKEFSVNYNRQSPTYRKMISGLIFPFGKWYFDMSAMQVKWMWKGKNAEDSFVKAVTGRSLKEHLMNTGEKTDKNFSEAFRIARQKNIGFLDGKVQLGALPKAALITMLPFLMSWYANYRNDDVAEVERQLPEGLRQKFHWIYNVERLENGALNYKVWSPQTPADVLIGSKFFNTAADVAHRYRTGEISSWDEAGKKLVKNWFGAEARGFFNLSNPMIKFMKGIITNKDPYDGTPVFPRYRPWQELDSGQLTYYMAAYFTKCNIPLFGTYVSRTEYRKESPGEVIFDMAERTGIPTQMNEPARGLQSIVGIKEYEGFPGFEQETKAGGKQFISRQLESELKDKYGKPETKIMMDIEDDWIKSGMTPDEFMESTKFQKSVEGLKKLHGDRIGDVADSLEKRISNIFENPMKIQTWAKNQLTKAKTKEEKDRYREILYEAKQMSREQQFQSLTKSTREHAGDILAEELGFDDYAEYERQMD